MFISISLKVLQGAVVSEKWKVCRKYHPYISHLLVDHYMFVFLVTNICPAVNLEIQKRNWRWYKEMKYLNVISTFNKITEIAVRGINIWFTIFFNNVIGSSPTHTNFLVGLSEVGRKGRVCQKWEGKIYLSVCLTGGEKTIWNKKNCNDIPWNFYQLYDSDRLCIY